MIKGLKIGRKFTDLYRNNTAKVKITFLRVITVEGVNPGAGDSSLGDDSLDAGPVSHSSSHTIK